MWKIIPLIAKSLFDALNVRVLRGRPIHPPKLHCNEYAAIGLAAVTHCCTSWHANTPNTFSISRDQHIRRRIEIYQTQLGRLSQFPLTFEYFHSKFNKFIHTFRGEFLTMPSLLVLPPPTEYNMHFGSNNDRHEC